jgi:hypothetical protein
VIVEVPIRPEFSKWAAEKCGDHIHGSAYHNVPNKFKANNTFCGYIAEAAWWSQHPDAQHVNVSEYDFLTKKGTRIDVKGIQSRYPPRPHYHFIVSEADIFRRPDVYFSVTVVWINNSCWLNGYISEAQFKELAYVHKKGDPYPIGKGHFKEACRTLEMGQLNPYTRPYQLQARKEGEAWSGNLKNNL